MAHPHIRTRRNTLREPRSTHDPEHDDNHWGEFAKAIDRGEGPVADPEPSNRHERRRAAALARQRKVA